MTAESLEARLAALEAGHTSLTLDSVLHWLERHPSAHAAVREALGWTCGTCKGEGRAVIPTPDGVGYIYVRACPDCGAVYQGQHAPQIALPADPLTTPRPASMPAGC